MDILWELRKKTPLQYTHSEKKESKAETSIDSFSGWQTNLRLELWFLRKQPAWFSMAWLHLLWIHSSRLLTSWKAVTVA